MTGTASPALASYAAGLGTALLGLLSVLSGALLLVAGRRTYRAAH